jgi:hypothetical protein
MNSLKPQGSTNPQPKLTTTHAVAVLPIRHQSAISFILSTITTDILQRIGHLCSRAKNTIFLAFPLLPKASATAIVFEPIHSVTPEIAASVGNETGSFSLSDWNYRGHLIRSGNTNEECLGNLSWAIQTLGTLNAAEYNGASGALSLLPTAGALIGAPTKELWVVYKLMPVAGVLTMFLSLGGTITPSQAGDYDPKASYSYGGMISTDWTAESRLQRGPDDRDSQHTSKSVRFAAKVNERARDTRGGSRYWAVWLGVLIQMVLVGVVLVALWFGQLGGVITWWCRVKPPLCSFMFKTELITRFLYIVVGLDVVLVLSSSGNLHH